MNTKQKTTLHEVINSMNEIISFVILTLPCILLFLRMLGIGLCIAMLWNNYQHGRFLRYEKFGELWHWAHLILVPLALVVIIAENFMLEALLR